MKSQDNIDSWFSLLPVEVSRTAHDLLCRVEQLREEQVIYPAQSDIFNALSFNAPSDIRAVILGQDPYHGPGQAMGLAFSVPKGMKIPPSLRNIHKELSSDLGCDVPCSGDLTPWAQRGVLLLNTTLTVREHAANSHAKLGWQEVTANLVRVCFEQPQPIVFFAWGRHAQELIDTAAKAAAHEMGENSSLTRETGENRLGVFEPIKDKFVISSTHPSPLSASRPAGDMPAFLGSKPFSKANDLIASCGGAPIDWASVCESSQLSMEM